MATKAAKNEGRQRRRDGWRGRQVRFDLGGEEGLKAKEKSRGCLANRFLFELLS